MALNLIRIKEFVSENNYEHAELYLAPEGKYFLFVYKIEGKYFAQSEDKIYGGFDNIDNVCFRRNGKVFAFRSSNFTKKLGLIKEGNQDSLLINGRTLGPFNKIREFSFNDNLTYYLIYDSYSTSFVIINNEKYGAYRNIFRVFLSKDGTSYAIHYKKDGHHFIKLNDQVYGPYESVSDFNMDYPRSFHCYICQKNSGEYFAEINGRSIGPFEKCSDLNYYPEQNSYFFLYQKNGHKGIQVNNFVLSGYESYNVSLMNKNFALISTMNEKQNEHHMISHEHGIFSSLQEYSLSSSKEETVFSYYKMGQYYVIAGDFEYGPYQKVSALRISENGKSYSFVFSKHYDNSYININGNIYGPYLSVSDVKISNNPDDYSFIYSKGGKFFVNVSGELHGMYDSASNLIMSNSGKFYSYKFSKKIRSGMFSKIENYLSLNGDIIEDGADIVDIKTNSIGSNSIIFRRKGGWYISLDGDVTGPYGIVSDWRFLPDETLFAFKYRDRNSDIDHLRINGRSYFSRNKNLQIYAPIFSSDKKRYAFIHYSDTHHYVQICDETYGPFDHANFPSFSPDSKIFIFRYQHSEGVYLNINGMKLGPFTKAEYTFHEDKLFISYLQDDTIFIDEITWIL